MVIEYNNIDVWQESTEVLTNVSFGIDEGEFVYITGKVGSGKSSLMKTLYAELPVSEDGTATVLGYDMQKLKRKHVPDLRKRLGIVFQDFQLLTDRTVAQNLNFVLRSTGWDNKELRKQRIQEVLDLVGMSTKGYKMPYELSGGEQQRIAVARAFLNSPKLILADEPTGNLDKETGEVICNLLHDYVKENNATVLMITHNHQLLEQFTGRVFECVDKHFVEVK